MLDDKLKLLKLIGQGSDNSRLVYPYGVAVTDNVIAVSDWGSHQVNKYSLQKESSYQCLVVMVIRMASLITLEG